MSNDLFRDFIDPENHISRILIAHFLALQLIMLPILDREWAGRTKNTPARMNLAWMTTIYETSPEGLRNLVEWPQKVAEAVNDERKLYLRQFYLRWLQVCLGLKGISLLPHFALGLRS